MRLILQDIGGAGSAKSGVAAASTDAFSGGWQVTTVPRSHTPGQTSTHYKVWAPSEHNLTQKKSKAGSGGPLARPWASHRGDTVDRRVFAPPGWLVHPATGCKNSYSGHVFRIYLIQFLYRVSQTPTKNERGMAFGHAPKMWWGWPSATPTTFWGSFHFW